MKTTALATLLAGIVGALAGVASAAFLFLLERATSLRETHPYLLFALPLAGVVIGWTYQRWGTPIRGGNNLVIDTVHDLSAPIPMRMAPMVLVGTVLTHLFGGSAGREGTAVQMGASLADALAHRGTVRARISEDIRRQLIIAGMAGGFGSVFGTPFAGAVFGLEVVSVGSYRGRALLPAIVASFVGDFVTRHLGIVHMPYPTITPPAWSALLVAKLFVVAVAMALASIVFIELTHRSKARFETLVPISRGGMPMRMFIGGVVIVMMTLALGTHDYLGLGLPLIQRAFSDPWLPVYAFAVKLLFTSVTLASGYLGGEVTPLFVVGATLGSVVARALHLPIGFGAGLGLAAVFGAAANAPLALSIMAAELLGAPMFPYALLVTAIAYAIGGDRSLYTAQRLYRSKRTGRALATPIAIRDRAGGRW